MTTNKAGAALGELVEASSQGMLGRPCNEIRPEPRLPRDPGLMPEGGLSAAVGRDFDLAGTTPARFRRLRGSGLLILWLCSLVGGGLGVAV